MALADRVANIVAHWPLSEASGTRADSVGSNDLTDNNTVGSGTGPVLSVCADFERDNSEYLSIADNADLRVGDIDFAGRLLLNIETILGDDTPIFSKWASGDLEYILTSESNRIRWLVRDGDSVNQTVSCVDFGTIPTGSWHLVHFWHSATNNILGIAVNGVETTISMSSGIRTGTAAFQLGGHDGGTAYFDGLMSDVVLIKGAVFSTAEITEDYNSGSFTSVADWSGGGGGGTANNYYHMLQQLALQS